MDLEYLQAKEEELKSRLEACLRHSQNSATPLASFRVPEAPQPNVLLQRLHRAELEELNSEHNAEMAEVQRELTATKARLQELSLERELELESVRAAADREIQRLLAQHRQEIQTYTTQQLAKEQRSYETASNDHQTELRQLQRSHNSAMSALQQQLALTQQREVDLHAELEAWKSRHTNLEHQRFDLESQVQAMDAKQTELQNILQQLQQEQLVTETKLHHQRELASVSLQQEVASLKQETTSLSERLAQQAKLHASAIERVQLQKEDACHQLEAQLNTAREDNQALQKAMQRHRQDMSRLRKQHAEQIEGMEADHKTVLATQRTHSQDLASQDRQRLQAQMAELRKEKGRVDADLAQARSSLQDAEQRLRVAHARHDAQHRELVTKLKDSVLEENQRTSKQLHEQHANEVQELRTQLQRLQLSSRLEIESFQESYSADMQRQAKQFQEIQSQQQERERQLLQELHSANDELQSIEERHQLELDNLLKAQDQERQQQDANLSTVASQARDAIEKERRVVLQQQQDALKQASDKIKLTEQQHQEDMQQLRTHNSELAKKLEAAEDRILLLEGRTDHEIEQFRAQHASATKVETDKLNLQLQQLKLENKHLTEEYAQLQQTSQRRLTDLQSRHEADFKSRLDTTLQKDYEQTIDALQRQASCSYPFRCLQ
eukprot:m.104554 g.104554  ORF g.104554 m.104554 type:complete len:669 (-) comp15253_c0_seq2:954-2960(-)